MLPHQVAFQELRHEREIIRRGIALAQRIPDAIYTAVDLERVDFHHPNILDSVGLYVDLTVADENVAPLIDVLEDWGCQWNRGYYKLGQKRPVDVYRREDYEVHIIQRRTV